MKSLNPIAKLTFNRAARCLWLALVLCLPPALQAQVALPWYEPFQYGENEQLGAAGLSGTTWTTGNSASGSSARIVAAAAMNYVGLLPDTNTTPRGLRSNTGTGKNRGVVFPAISSGTIYASFVLNVLTNPTVARPLFALSSAGAGATTAAGNATVWLESSGRLSLGKTNGSPILSVGPALAAPLAPTNAYLVVLAYKFNAGASTNDEVDLWVDPIPLGNAANIPAPTLVYTNGPDAASIQSAFFQAPTSAVLALFYLDELRVGTTWDSVMPLADYPGTTNNVTGGGFVCNGAGVPVGLSGSDSGVDYWLMTNGAPTGIIQAGTGGVISFGSQTNEGYYTVFGSNTTTFATGWMNGNATVANGCPPVIVTQPSSLTVPSGSSCTYSVVASGAGLTYQWRHDGTNISNNGHFSGATTANLTIYPVGAGDVSTAPHGYDVVVSGQFGSPATSTRVSLTLGAAQDLVWVGDSVSNLWDVLTSANWNVSGGGPSVFNFGDKVTFDDTTGNMTVTLNSPFLSPTTLTVSAGTYTFTGNGNISGAGTVLIASNTANLTMNIANSYGGGTIIQSNAIINLQYPGSLGTGPVQLAGGNLHIIAPTKSLNYGNPIQVVTDSTISGISGSTPSFNSTITVTGGSLTFSGDSSTSFFSPNISTHLNLSLPMVLNNTALALISDTTAPDVFNEIISGNGSVQRRGTGTVYLNQTNTFTGNALLSTGGMGIGCSSVASNSPPTVDAGPVGAGLLAFDDGAAAAAQWLFASGGARFVGNNMQMIPGTNNFTLVFAGTNDLELGGSLNGGTGVLTVRTTNSAVSTLSGGISQSAGLTKTGNGLLILKGDLNYAGGTTNTAGRMQLDGNLNDGSDTVLVSGGTLSGSGTIQGPVVVQSGAALSPGQSGLGTLTINNSLDLAGNVTVQVDKSQIQSNGLVVVNGSFLTNSGVGTVTVANAGPALTVGDSFTIFSQAVSNGTALTVNGGGATWVNHLAVDGSIQVLSTMTVISIPPAITGFSLSSGTNVVISGTNGQTGATAYLLYSTNLALPRNQWKTIGTNVLNGSNYSFTSTNAVKAGFAQQFYTLSSTNFNP